MGCAAKWHVEAGGAVQSLTAWKRNAGASHLVDRKPTTLSYKLPDVIRSNVTPPALHVGKQVMFFLPDIVLVQDSARVGAVKYADLSIRWQNSRFIETDHVPRDAQVVDHTWKHPNKRGGPDRRFRDNRQIPVCLYETMHLTSHSGINELVEFSRVGVAPAFADGCRLLAALPQGRTTALPSIPISDASTAPAGTTARKPSRVTAAVLSVIGILVGIPVLGTLFGSDGKEAASEISPTAPQFSEPPAAAVRTTEAHRENRIGPALQPPRTVTSDVVQSESGINDEAAPNTLRYTKTAVNLREGPGTGYAIITVVPMGSEVSVIESRGAWSRVSVDADAHGWMANSTIAPR